MTHRDPEKADRAFVDDERDPIRFALLERVRDAAVAASSGGWLDLATHRGAAIVVGRVCDPEPLLATERHLGLSAPERLVRGLGVAGVACEARRLLLAVDGTSPELLDRVAAAARPTRIEVVPIAPCTPLDPTSLLLDLAASVAAVATAATGAVVLDAVELGDLALASEGRPALRRTLTVAGHVRSPSILRAPLGTAVSDLLSACGGSLEPGCRVYENGVLGGSAVEPDRAVSPWTRGLVVLPPRHDLVVRRTAPLADELRRVPAACTGCRVCSDVCPARLDGGRLEPHLLMRGLLASAGRPADPVPALECRGCGLCSLFCPAGLHPAAIVASLSPAPPARVVPGIGAPAPRPLEERAGRRVSVARATSRLGLDGFAPARPRSADVLPDLVTLAAPWGELRPAVPLGARVRAGELVLLAPEGSRRPGVRAPVAGTVERIDPDDGMVLRAE
jgi:Na+-translocating ferredoxin:NAD+ oxidoreductase RnfC subunit